MSAFTQPLAQVRAFVNRNDHHTWHHRERELPEGRSCAACDALAALARVERLAAEMETTLENLKREIDLYPTLYEGLTPIIAVLSAREEGDGAR